MKVIHYINVARLVLIILAGWKMQNSSALLIFNSDRISDMILVNNKKRNNWGCGAAGSALAWHARGHGFDPRQLHFLI